MRAEADEANVETEWLNLKRPDLGEDGGEFNLFFSSPSSPLHRLLLLSQFIRPDT